MSRSSHHRSFGSVRRLSSGRWQVRYTAPDSSRHSAPHTFDTRRAAEDWLAATRADVLRGSWINPTASAVSFGRYAADWLATRVDLAPRTRELYSAQLRRWVNTELPDPTGATIALGAVPLARLDLPTVRRWFAAVTEAAARSAAGTGPRVRRHPARVWAESDAGRAALAAEYLTVKPTGRLSPAVLAAWQRAGAPMPGPKAPRGSGSTQAAQAYRFVRTVANAAVADGLMPANPCRLPRAGLTQPAERTTASRTEIDALAAAMPAHLSAAVQVAAWSGLRAGELFALDRSRVDLDAGTVRVDRTLDTRAGRVVGFGPPKTAAGYRLVHLPPHVTAILAEHLATYTRPGPAALLFAHPRTGAAISEAARTRAFHQARKAVGRPDLRWHDLRHTSATLAAQAGASVRELQHRLGHATAHAAMIYQHATAERDRDVAARMAAIASPVPALALVVGGSE